MDKKRKQELLQRQLGLRHKLKVHDSVKQPETHEEMAVNWLARWELEDEIAAIDSILADARRKASQDKRALIEKELGMGKTLQKKKKA